MNGLFRNRMRVLKLRVSVQGNPWAVLCGFCAPDMIPGYPPPHRVAPDWWTAQDYAQRHASLHLLAAEAEAVSQP